MKKYIFIILSFSIIFLIYSFFKPYNCPECDTYNKESKYDEEINSMGLDPTTLFHKQKEEIILNNLIYKGSSFEVDFAKKNTEFGFYRDWSLSNYYVGDDNKDLQCQSYLFFDELNNTYYIYFNYKWLKPFSIYTKYLNNDYVEFNYSKTFQTTRYMQSYNYLEYQGKEYLHKQDSGVILMDEGKISFRILYKASDQPFKYPISSGYTRFVVEPRTEDVNLDFFEFDTDLYYTLQDQDERVELGLNEFNSFSKELKFSVKSMKVIYDKGDH